MSAPLDLRAATASAHERVDAAYSRFDLADRDSYGAFLTAHARALPAVETALSGMAGLPPLRPRQTLLAADLASLGLPQPPRLTVASPDSEAAAFGMAYVIEGSRLGGGLLARRVGQGQPTAYLGAVHLPGEWRAFGQALDRAASSGGADWIRRAIEAARAVFRLYEEAAALRS